MNRWVCRDFYKIAWWDAFIEWKKGMIRVFHELGTYDMKYYPNLYMSMTLSHDHNARIICLFRNPYVTNYTCYYDEIYQFQYYEYFPDGKQPPIPKKYYFSNGSRMRKDGSYGWD